MDHDTLPVGSTAYERTFPLLAIPYNRPAVSPGSRHLRYILLSAFQYHRLHAVFDWRSGNTSLSIFEFFDPGVQASENTIYIPRCIRTYCYYLGEAEEPFIYSHEGQFSRNDTFKQTSVLALATYHMRVSIMR